MVIEGPVEAVQQAERAPAAPPVANKRGRPSTEQTRINAEARAAAIAARLAANPPTRTSERTRKVKSAFASNGGEDVMSRLLAGNHKHLFQPRPKPEKPPYAWKRSSVLDAPVWQWFPFCFKPQAFVDAALILSPRRFLFAFAEAEPILKETFSFLYISFILPQVFPSKLVLYFTL